MDRVQQDLDTHYYDITADIDAREILRYLNKIGIYNISGEVLKYFITDLKKFIKYDLKLKYQNQASGTKSEGPERLHSVSTFSSRSRSKCDNVTHKCPKEHRKTCSRLQLPPFHSMPNLQIPKNIPTNSNNINEETSKSKCMLKKLEKKSDAILSHRTKTTTSSANLIRVQRQPSIKRCDPVSLYHYYTSFWEKYRNSVPGENNWSELRWSIRQKMAGTAADPVPGKL